MKIKNVLMKIVGTVLICAITVTSFLGIASASSIYHTDHYKLILFFNDWERTSGTIYADYYPESKGSLNMGTYNAFAAGAWEGFDYSPFEMQVESNYNNADVHVVSDDYGNQEWVGVTNPNFSKRLIKINEYFLNEEILNEDHYFEVVDHEWGHIWGLADHYDVCTLELMNGDVRTDPVTHPFEGDIQGIYDKY